MFWKKKSVPGTLGVALEDLQQLLQSTAIKATINGNTLLARHEKYRSSADVVVAGWRSAACQTAAMAAEESHVGGLLATCKQGLRETSCSGPRDTHAVRR